MSADVIAGQTEGRKLGGLQLHLHFLEATVQFVRVHEQEEGARNSQQGYQLHRTAREQANKLLVKGCSMEAAKRVSPLIKPIKLL